MGGSTADLCWKEVATHKLPGKTHPEVICIHCQKIWHSNNRQNVVTHLTKCPELPQRLYSEYQPHLLEAPKGALKPNYKQPREGAWHDSIETVEAAVLDELLAEFFFGAGIALSSVRSHSINILVTY
jgi:hypothetical protein